MLAKWTLEKKILVVIGVIILISIINMLAYQRLSREQLSSNGNPVALSSESKKEYLHIDAIKYCNELVAPAELARDKDISTIYSDWYLPTFEEISEFKGKVGKSQNPLWTSTERGILEWDAIVLPVGGWLRYRDLHDLHVRCVRNDTSTSEPNSISPFNSDLYTYSEALTYCENLSAKPEFTRNGVDAAIYDDWRLPTTAEIYQFVGYKKFQVFDIWTNTKSVNYPVEARNVVNLVDGSTKEMSITLSNGAQCVR